MLFNSLLFVFLFLPVTVAGWYIIGNKLNKKCAVVFLTAMSLWFYGYANPYYLILIILSILVNYSANLLFEKVRGSNQKLILVMAIALNVGALGYFKYRNFFVESINSVFKTGFATRNIILPLGISFFTLSSVAFLVDRYRKEAEYADVLSYSAFVLYFPKLLSGPIAYYDEIIPEFKGEMKAFDSERFLSGLRRFVLGLSKKVLLADTLGLYADYGMGACYYFDTASAWVWALFYSLEIYFDFSGYSDMAMGISDMFGISLPENFNEPYKARTVKDFWRRWHMTLTRFLTKYIYIPLGGNRKGTLRMVINTIIVFAVSGLWHGASWTFVLWGLLHAVAILISGALHKKKPGNTISHVFTMIFVVFAWAIFRADSYETMCVVIRKMFSLSHTGFLRDLCTSLVNQSELFAVIKILETRSPELLLPMYEVLTVFLVVLSFALMKGGDVKKRVEKESKHTGFGGFVLAVLFVWSIVSFSNVTTFLYFTF